MPEINDESVHLMVTSPPYFNAPFDYNGLYSHYNQYLDLLQKFASETFRILQPGRIAVLNVDDILVDGQKFPIVADAIRVFLDAGFRYRDKIVWKKPDGYLRISKRSGVLMQNPYPMYFYPDNLLESIVIFQKGKFDYKSISDEVKEASKIDVSLFQKEKWYMTLWEMTNVLPIKKNILKRGIAAFPDELPRRAITLFSYVGETVLDPFLGSGTTMKVAKELGRNSIGYEILDTLEPIILQNTGLNEPSELNDATIEIIRRV